MTIEAVKPPPQRPKLSKKYIWLVAVLIFLGFGQVLFVRLKQKNEREQAIKNMTPPATAVAVMYPRRGKISERLTTTGSLIPREEVQLVPKVNGRLLQLLVREGSHVAAGQWLGDIDHAELTAQLAQARAQVDVAQANLNLLVNGPLMGQLQQARANVRQLESTVRQMQANATHANQEWLRQQNLAIQGVITQQQLATTQTQAEVARQQVAGSQQQVIASRAALRLLEDGNRPEQIAAARAQVAQARATVQLYLAQMSHYQLKAPFSGVVTKRHVDPGALVGPPNPVVTISQSLQPELQLNLPERQLEKIHTGQLVWVRVPALPGDTLSATITEISPVVDPQTRLLKVKARVNSPVPLKTGMLVSCEIVLNETASTWLLPPEALIAEEHQMVVYVAVANRVKAKPVVVGLRNPQEVEIRQGLGAGDAVIVKGNAFIRPGDRIQVQILSVNPKGT